jgi:hypothetical protein
MPQRPRNCRRKAFFLHAATEDFALGKAKEGVDPRARRPANIGFPWMPYPVAGEPVAGRRAGKLPGFRANCVSNYRGTRVGAQYRGDLKLGANGLLIFGARTERRSAATAQTATAVSTTRYIPGITANPTSNSIFALHQFNLGERLFVSAGGRLDGVAGRQSFATGRITSPNVRQPTRRNAISMLAAPRPTASNCRVTPC